MALRIAHLSDLHLLSLEGAVPYRLFNKRFTGWVNLRMHRNHVHRPFAAHAVAREIRRLDIDHVVITGDVTNLSLEVEFELVRAFVDDHLGMPPDRVSMVPGNHDVYTRGSHRDQRFRRYFGPFMTDDRPTKSAVAASNPQTKSAVAASNRGGAADDAFPYLRLRGPAAIIGLCTATPRLPLVASGELGDAQLSALARLLELPEVRGRFPVLLQHHPWHNPPSRARAFMNGLADAPAEKRVLRSVAKGLLLHGHLHRRIHQAVPTDAGQIDAIGTTSASLLDERDERMAGFNVYEIGDDHSLRVTSHRLVLAPGGQTGAGFREVPVPRA